MPSTLRLLELDGCRSAGRLKMVKAEGQGSAFGDKRGRDGLIVTSEVAQKRGMIGPKKSRSRPSTTLLSSIRANASCFISVKNAPLVPLVQHSM